ncbi:SpoIID/LytB domain-containing protein [Bacteroidota bacterium]
MDEKPVSISMTLQSRIILLNEKKKVAEINQGNSINFRIVTNQITAKIGGRNFYGKYFQLVPADGMFIDYNNKSFKGSLRIVGFGNYIDIINIENYLKGVISKEMPLGEGMENYEALKAFAISARTYTISKMNNSAGLFDIYADTRDQVYGGNTAEDFISSKAVEETQNMILYYNGEPAKVYYHSTCGGVSEDALNVFPQSKADYLISVKDGNDPFCNISPRFKWKEEYSEQEFITKLFNAGLISDKSYKLSGVSIKSKFKSGRVNDLEIILVGDNGSTELHLYGNEIRSVLRTPRKNLTLWSTLFTIKILSNGNIVLDGRGYGHGVGLCQWGAISQSQRGINFEQIIKHYYPGTELGRIND